MTSKLDFFIQFTQPWIWFDNKLLRGNFSDQSSGPGIFQYLRANIFSIFSRRWGHTQNRWKNFLLPKVPISFDLHEIHFRDQFESSKIKKHHELTFYINCLFIKKKKNPQTSDCSFLEKCHFLHGLNTLYCKPRMATPPVFSIKHYAGEVIYEVLLFPYFFFYLGAKFFIFNSVSKKGKKFPWQKSWSSSAGRHWNAHK